MKIVVLGSTCVTATALGLTSGAAATSGSHSATEYHACLSSRTHLLSDVVYNAAAPTCAKGERSVSWDVRGPAGPRGAKGATGAVGAAGPAGPQGQQGDPGPAGANGANGTDGKDGTNGKDGLNGKDGTNGKDGLNGKDGTNGKDGAQGPSGTSIAYNAAVDKVDINGSTGSVTAITKTVPAGTYAISAKLVAFNNDEDNYALVSCVLTAAGVTVDQTVTSVPELSVGTLPLQGVNITTGGDLTVSCSEPGPSDATQLDYIKITAIKLDASA